MTVPFQLFLGLDDIEKFDSGKIKTVIYCRFGETLFPDEFWDDFTLIVLEWWSQATARLIAGISDQEKLQFMDGPMEMNVKVIEKGICQVTCINRMEEEQRTFTVELNNLAREIVKGAEKLINKCEAINLKSEDLDDLIKSRRILSEIKKL